MGTEMRRMLVGGIVVALAAAAAQAGVITTITFEKAVTVGSTIVDVYKITQTADDPSNTVGAVLLGFGTAPRVPHPDPNEPSIKVTPEMGDDPYQAWMRYSATVIIKTVSQSDANSFLHTDPSAREADSHFLYTNWTPIVVSPDELNDYSIYNPGTAMGVAQGKGALYVQASVASGDRQNSMDVCQVGVVRGDTVCYWTASADNLGDVTEDDWFHCFPEPASGALLAAGAFALLGRRRR